MKVAALSLLLLLSTLLCSPGDALPALDDLKDTLDVVPSLDRVARALVGTTGSAPPVAITLQPALDDLKDTLDVVPSLDRVARATLEASGVAELDGNIKVDPVKIPKLPLLGPLKKLLRQKRRVVDLHV